MNGDKETCLLNIPYQRKICILQGHKIRKNDKITLLLKIPNTVTHRYLIYGYYMSQAIQSWAGYYISLTNPSDWAKFFDIENYKPCPRTWSNLILYHHVGVVSCLRARSPSPSCKIGKRSYPVPFWRYASELRISSHNCFLMKVLCCTAMFLW